MGEKAQLTNGSVEECDRFGVKLGGAGKHKVERILAKEGENVGFLIESNDNKLTLNTAQDNDSDGFDIHGVKNKFDRNTASDNDTGFDLDRRDSNDDEVPAVQNILTQNVAADNSEVGSEVDRTSTGNKLLKNVAVDNGEGNVDDARFRIDGDENKLIQNRSQNNNPHGILLRSIPATSEPNDNVLTKNVAQGNTTTYVQDDTVACDNNKWNKTTLQTSEVAGGGPNPGCIE